MKYKLKNIFNNRKTLYLVFVIVLVSVFILTIAYAALNTVLNITGNAEVVASSWDIYLDNVQLVSGSVTSDVPIVTDKTTATFTTRLTKPGDYYMFTIDVVNNGTIDAMIESIDKTPTLTSEQAKYLNYIVEYQNGTSINTKQLVEANSFVRLKIRVEFRKDISASDLPSISENLNLSFKVNYVQADEVGTSSIQNNGKLVKVVSGDYDTVGSEICIKDECFYVISSTDDDVTMFAKYNLLVGFVIDEDWNVTNVINPTGKQDINAKGLVTDENGKGVYPWYGTVAFSDSTTNYNNSLIKKYVQDYVDILENFGVIVEGRLINLNELDELGCVSKNNSCNSSIYDWVYSTSYWTANAYNDTHVWYVYSHGFVGQVSPTSGGNFGVRPVIVISKSEF